jgi:hypothetical protein
VPVSGTVECRVDLRARVKLLDISLTGALIAGELSLPVGAAASLRSDLGNGTFRTVMQVRHNLELRRGVPLRGIGASFTTMDERSRRSLEEFLQKASS